MCNQQSNTDGMANLVLKNKLNRTNELAHAEQHKVKKLEGEVASLEATLNLEH